jgi:hypothetical protein
LNHKVLIIAATLGMGLSGCGSSLPKYTEPDSKQMRTARLRIVVPAGVGAEVATYPHSNSICLQEEGALELPTHINTSGFAGESKKKIGMPLEKSFEGKIGTEMYIPATQPMTIGARYSGTGMSCFRAFRFSPAENKDYQLFIMAGSGGVNINDSCMMELKEMPPSAKSSTEFIPVKFEQIVVEGSPAWGLLCSTNKAK